MSVPIVAALLQAAALPMAASPACPAALAAAPARACVPTTDGVVLATEPAEAERLAQALRAGEQRFRHHFRRPPPRTAVIQDPAPGETAALTAAGFVGAVPMMSAARFREAAIASVRRGSEAKAKAASLSAEATAQVVTQAEAAWVARDKLPERLANEQGVLPHEAGHLWLIAAFWPTSAKRGGHYGGPGPDWLDETAAVLMETDKFAADRRRGFADVYRGAPTDGALADLSAAELIDLPRFLSRDHPGAGKSLQLSTGQTVQPGVPFRAAAGQAVPVGATMRVLVGDEARAMIRGGLLFYLQSRVFADFLIERTGDPAVFADIASALGRGGTMTSWLQAEGVRRNLPGTIAALDGAWREWLTAKYGAPKPAMKPTAPTTPET